MVLSSRYAGNIPYPGELQLVAIPEFFYLVKVLPNRHCFILLQHVKIPSSTLNAANVT